MIDYEAINNSLTPEHVKSILKKLDIPFKETPTYLLMPTVCHHAIGDSDASWKLYYYFNNKIFMCYTECGAQSIWKFLKHFYEANGIEYDWYSDIYLLITEGVYNPNEGFTAPKYESLKDKYARQEKLITLPAYNEGVLDCFIKTYPPEWLNDGISKEAMDKFQILYSISQNKIIIPHRDEAGRLVGIRGRALDEWEIENVGKYMPVQVENTWYKHPLSMNLYGLYENKDNIKKNGICFVAESEKSVLQAESFERDNCFVAVCGSHFNKFELQKIMTVAEPREIIICFDKEELPGEDKYFNKLYKMCEKYSNYAQFSFIYDREKLLELKDSPTDKGEEVFEKLLKRKVLVQ